MKNILYIVSFYALLLSFVGCGSTGGTPEEIKQDQNDGYNGVPTPKEIGDGQPILLKEFLYYDRGFENISSVNKDIHIYEYYQDGEITYKKEELSFVKGLDIGKKNDVITKTADNKKISEDIIYLDKIVSYIYDKNENFSHSIEYPLQIRVGELFYRTGNEKVCVAKNIVDTISFDSILPANISTYLSQEVDRVDIKYDDILHIYCGNIESSYEDIYYALGYGKVFSKVVSEDRTTYTIVNRVDGFWE